MKKRMVAILCLIAVFSAIRVLSPVALVEIAQAEGDYVKNVSEFTGTGEYQDGTYEGEAEGYNGMVKMSVTVQKGHITALKLLETNDDKEYLDKVIEPVLTGVLDKQLTSEVDTISGATFSSCGILDAIDDALAKA